MINIDTFRPFQVILSHKNKQYFKFNEENQTVIKKNIFHKHYHDQICSVPASDYMIIGNSSFLTLIIFFNRTTLRINDNEMICMPYSIVLINQGCQYEIKQSNPSGPIFIYDCDPDFFDDVMISQMADCPIFYDLITLKTDQKEHLLFDYRKDDSILLSLHLLLNELIHRKQMIHTHRNVKLIFLVLLGQLDRHHIPYLIIHDSSMMPVYDEGKILKYLSDNFSTATLSSTAAYFNFHPTYFSSLFKKLFHESFSKKLLSLKLEHAKRLLMTTDMSTQEIMSCVGFNDRSYFFKSFKQYYQMTPMQYRKNNQTIYHK